MTLGNMSIIISKNFKNAVKVNRSSFALEDNLQAYIHNNPESIPLYDIKEDVQLLILAREFPTASGPIDAVGIDRDGEIYLVETKLYKNPDKRTVVAQVLDYGASLWKSHPDFDSFLLMINNSVQEAFNQTVRERIQSFFSLDEDSSEALISSMAENLNGGNFRFVVLMDTLHDRLKDLILYMNQNSKFDIYGVELEYYKHNDFEIMIPKLFGAEVKKDVSKTTTPSGRRKKWDEVLFMEDLAQKLENPESAHKLFNVSKEVASTINWGTGVSNGSANFIFNNISRRSVYTLFSDGTLQLNFGWLDEEQAIPYRDAFAKALIDIGMVKSNLKVEKDWVKVQYENWLPKVDEFMQVVKDILTK